MATLRGLTAADRGPIERVLRSTGAFTESEVAVALELVDEGLGAQGEDPYLFLVAVGDQGEAQGYTCFGRVPASLGDFDLYWIAVDPTLQGRGVGRILLTGAENEARSSGARRMLIETASKPSYAATRAFYERSGYRLIEREANHYAPGDDRLVYARELDAATGRGA